LWRRVSFFALKNRRNFAAARRKFVTDGAMAVRFHFCSLAALAAVVLAAPADAQTRKPTVKEIAAIRDCAARTKEDVDAGEQKCLFKLVADPCIGEPGSAPDAVTADCYRIEGAIWDILLNENYKSLLEGLDGEQTAKARAMQRAWVAYRDTTCGFYDDKIRGSMSNMMHAACHTRETARRAMLLDFFSGL
jgi:uncharacterized protein YecT (DUF1311 family)